MLDYDAIVRGLRGFAALRNAQVTDVLKRHDDDFAEPLGEYPALPNVPGVEPPSPTGSTGHPIRDRHQITGSALTGYPWACLCGQAFRTTGGHAEHVAELLADTA